jgi:hypothetical protein
MSALGEYYYAMADAARQNAGSGALTARAGANLTNANAGMVQPLGQAQIDQQNAQAGLIKANTAEVHPLSLATQAKDYGSGAYTGALAGQVPAQAQSEIGLRQAQTGHELALTPGLQIGNQYRPYQPTTDAPKVNSPTAPTVANASGGMTDPNALGHAQGTSRIKAPGDGKVDTTTANLANGEAVLNKGAADHLGQPAIQALNAVGMLRMGMVPGADDRTQGANAAQTAGKTGAQGYAKGVSKAGPKGKADAKPAAKADSKDKPKGKDAAKPSDTPSLDQIDPKMLQAALQMGAMGQGQQMPGQDPQQMQMPPQMPGSTQGGMM